MKSLDYFLRRGSNIGAGVWSESKPHLLNKLNHVPWGLTQIAAVSFAQFPPSTFLIPP